MNKLLSAILVTAAFTSCAETYNVQGASTVASLDGSKLYLKAIKDRELTSIDSCEVVHGQFSFSGVLDTVRMANLYMDDQSILPVVLEQGEIKIKLDSDDQTVEGTPLNAKLYQFLEKHNRLMNQMSELGHKQNQMILDGIDEDIINAKINAEAAKIAHDEDTLVTKFIEANYDNVLGPGVFMMITSQYRYPILTPQIEYIMSKASETFKSDPYVVEYLKAAHENEQRLQGMGDEK